MPTTTLMATYPAKPQRLPPCSITSDSFEKVEKVVKPPQSPTVRNKAQLLPSVPFLLNMPHRRPIRKQPTRLTASVAQGKPLLTPFIASETRYLAAPPRKLPAPTANMVFINSINVNLNYSSSMRSTLKMTGRVPSEQQHIISFSCFIQPRMMEPPCRPV